MLADIADAGPGLLRCPAQFRLGHAEKLRPAPHPFHVRKLDALGVAGRIVQALDCLLQGHGMGMAGSLLLEAASAVPERVSRLLPIARMKPRKIFVKAEAA